MKNLVHYLRLIALFEGVSLLILLFIAMPMKYLYGNTEIVPVVGMAHGVLFLIFLGLSVFVSHYKSWSDKFWAALVIASMVPFGTFVMDGKLKQRV